MVRNLGGEGTELAGEFGPGNAVFVSTTPRDFGPLGESNFAFHTYMYTPVDRGPDYFSDVVTSNAGDKDLPLFGDGGVGPSYMMAWPDGAPVQAVIDLGDVDQRTFVEKPVLISNATPDADLDDLTDLTLVEITSEDLPGPPSPPGFSVLGFTPGQVLGKDESMELIIRLDTTLDGLGERWLAFTIHTDQGAEFGGDGKDFSYVVRANVVAPAIPEPAALGLIGLAAMAVRRRSS
jgi:hypothetical protein